jgi:hypothetical protein
MLRRHVPALAIGLSALALATTNLSAQERPRTGRGGGQITLNADDVAAFPEPSAGFDRKRDAPTASWRWSATRRSPWARRA